MNILEELNKISQYIDQLSVSDALNNSSTDSINIHAFGYRDNLIGQLTSVITTLPIFCKKVSHILDTARAAHERELNIVNALLNKVTNVSTMSSLAPVCIKQLPCQPIPSMYNNLLLPPHKLNTTVSNVNVSSDVSTTVICENTKETNWTKVNRKQTTRNTYALALTNQQSVTQNISKVQEVKEVISVLNKSKIRITDTLYLYAQSIESVNDIRQCGELYYIPTIDHFVIKIAGLLFHGNVGIIYTDEKTPMKIKDCKFAANCMKQDTCDYYHDPFSHPGSKDYRNYIANSFLYGNIAQHKLRPRGRKFGSREHLDIDIVSMQEEDISRYQDQTMHDILCNLIISQNLL